MEYYSNNYAHHDNYQSHNVTLSERAGQPLPPPVTEEPKVSSLARRIHGWSWQAVSRPLFLSRITRGIGLSTSCNIAVPHRYGHWRRLRDFVRS